MNRTQIYLTEEEQKALFSIANQTGKSKSELIRNAIDDYIEKFVKKNRLTLLRKARGIWQNRLDLPDFDKLRKEFNRDQLDE